MVKENPDAKENCQHRPPTTEELLVAANYNYKPNPAFANPNPGAVVDGEAQSDDDGDEKTAVEEEEKCPVGDAKARDVQEEVVGTGGAVERKEEKETMPPPPPPASLGSFQGIVVTKKRGATPVRRSRRLAVTPGAAARPAPMILFSPF